MREDRIKWNRKFSRERYPLEPSDIVCQFAAVAHRGVGLDIAAGTGRNASYLAEIGFEVEALDISDVGLNQFAGRHPLIRAACIDLDQYELPPNRYNLILNIRYLNRRLIPQIIAALVPGGVLIFETYLKRPEFTPQRPYCSDHLLEVNELLRGCIGMEIVYYREALTPKGDDPYPLASMVAINR